MNKVLLIYPPYQSKWLAPPLGLGYLASVLDTNDIPVEIIDMGALKWNDEDLLQEIQKDQPKIIGISFMTLQVGAAESIASRIKNVMPKTLIIVGGPHVSAIPKETLEYKAFDFAIFGEGEFTILELVKKIFSNEKDYKSIQGIAFRKNETVVQNPPREFLRELDKLPFPAWHLLPLDRYFIRGIGGDESKPTFAILSSRGCPNKCVFCDSHSVFSNKFRFRSAENIFTEMIYLKEKYNASQFDFVDDTVTVNKKRMFDLCQLFIDSKNDFSWMCNARVSTVTYDLLKKMKEAGCVRIDFGVESGDPEVLRAIKKNITLDQIKNAHRWCKELNIAVSSFFMVGNPGETWESIQMTASLAAELKSDFPSVGIATPYPGTELYHMARNRNWLIETDWKKYMQSAYMNSNYKPIMRTDTMSAEEIMKAYYFLNSRFFTNKFRIRYGRWFWFNPKFYRRTVFAGRSFRDVPGLFKIAFKLIHERGIK